MAKERDGVRGMFGYEGEGFDDSDVPPRSHTDTGPAAKRGWNIGESDDRIAEDGSKTPDSTPPRSSR